MPTNHWRAVLAGILPILSIFLSFSAQAGLQVGPLSWTFSIPKSCSQGLAPKALVGSVRQATPKERRHQFKMGIELRKPNPDIRGLIGLAESAQSFEVFSMGYSAAGFIALGSADSLEARELMIRSHSIPWVDTFSQFANFRQRSGGPYAIHPRSVTDLTVTRWWSTSKVLATQSRAVVEALYALSSQHKKDGEEIAFSQWARMPQSIVRQLNEIALDRPAPDVLPFDIFHFLTETSDVIMGRNKTFEISRGYESTGDNYSDDDFQKIRRDLAYGLVALLTAESQWLISQDLDPKTGLLRWALNDIFCAQLPGGTPELGNLRLDWQSVPGGRSARQIFQGLEGLLACENHNGAPRARLATDDH